MHRISYDSSVTLFILHRSEKRQFRISMPSLARRDPLTQDVPLYYLLFILYIVFTPCPATARSPP